MKKLDISSYDIKSSKIDKNIKLVFLSDLHNHNIIDDIVNSIDKINPDIIIFGGDMINENLEETNNFFDLYEKLKKYKIYYIYGNHEEVLNEEDFDTYTKMVNKTKINLLYNKSVLLSKNINLIGFVSDLSKYKKFKNNCLDINYINSMIGSLDKTKFNILVAHNPLEFKTYNEYGVDLVLSGHIHGGLIKLPLFGGLLSPNHTFFPKYYEGLYKKDNTKMIVSRGLGHSERIRVRINNNFEIVVINLIKVI